MKKERRETTTLRFWGERERDEDDPFQVPIPNDAFSSPSLLSFFRYICTNLDKFTVDNVE